MVLAATTEQNFNSGLALIGLSGTGHWMKIKFSVNNRRGKSLQSGYKFFRQGLVLVRVIAYFTIITTSCPQDICLESKLVNQD